MDELGERANILPGEDPHLVVTVRPIPSDERESAGRIIPVCEPRLDGNEEKYLLHTVRTNWISSAGKYITDFEQLFAQKVGARYGVACNNGTTALHLALATLGVGPGDEVIVPTFTMIASANAVRYVGATPVFIDAEPETGNMDVRQLRTKITPRTKAIMPMHTYGHPVDMDPVLDLAKQHNLFVLSDAAESHGAEYKGQPVGGLGDVATYSFYANKIITTGEGGMLTTNNPDIARIARNMRDHAFSHERHFWHKYLGFNFRMTNMQAAIGLAQTERFEFLVECRRKNAEMYSELLSSVPGLALPVQKPWAKNVYWMYGMVVQPAEFGMTRDALRNALAQRGIETRTFFIPIHLQPIYFRAHGAESFPVAEMLCERGMYLPSASTLTPADIEFISHAVREIQSQGRKSQAE
ncbi:MAG: DegT/DnrJ/EryC1/StrS family aminotransferase [Chloroflexi bacterium]|nr:DegT/DnrJ/EryC1/StrS family aminotransferase [Chloroflexota bacterium]